jgi:hypothetical protein
VYSLELAIVIDRRCFIRTLAAVAAIPKPQIYAQPVGYRWRLGAPVLDLTRPSSGEPVRLLDPCAVREGGKWHVFCGSLYFKLDEFNPGSQTPAPVPLPIGGAFVPQVFYFRPLKQWQLIGQLADGTGRYPKNAPCLCTNLNIDNPRGWSMPIVLDVPPPEDANNPIKAWNDFYMICDDNKAHLLATSAGRLWRSETRLSDYPRGWSKPIVALEGDFIYASHAYRHDTAGGTIRYWLNITGVSTDPANKQRRQYQQSYVADRIEGPWRAEAATWDQPFAGPANIRITDDRWQGDLVHGEPLRTGNDERMILDREISSFLFHGHQRDPKTGLMTANSECIGLLLPEDSA